MSKKPILLALAAILILAAVAVVVIMRQAPPEPAADWEKSKAELLARGEKLDFTSFVPAPIPDPDNFFADPMWQELSDLVPAENSFVKVPRIPRGKRTLDQAFATALPPLTPQEIADIQTKFPTLQWPENKADRGMVIRRLWFLNKAPDEGAGGSAQAILALLPPAQPFLQNIATLATRKAGRFSAQDEEGRYYVGERAGYLVRIAQLLDFRARASLVTGDTGTAAADILLTLRLSSFLAQDPFLIARLIENSLVATGLNGIDFGLKRHAWSDAQLQSFEAALHSIDLTSGLATLLRAERAANNSTVQRLLTDSAYADRLYTGMKQTEQATARITPPRDAFPTVMARAQAISNPAYQKWIDLLDSHPGDPHPSDVSADIIPVVQTVSQDALANLLAVQALETLHDSLLKSYYVQQQLDLTRLACALERHRLAHGALPATLDALAPAYLPAIPRDFFSRQSLIYRPTGDTFLLYSVSGNLQDNGGDARRDIERGDIVWGVDPKK